MASILKLQALSAHRSKILACNKHQQGGCCEGRKGVVHSPDRLCPPISFWLAKYGKFCLLDVCPITKKRRQGSIIFCHVN